MHKRWVLAVWLLACSDDAKSPSDRYVAKLRACKVLSADGKRQIGVAPDEACALSCLTEASCDDVRLYHCDEPETVFSASFRACRSQCIFERTDDCDEYTDECDKNFGFRCEDGDIVVGDAECDGVQDCDDGSDELRCVQRGLAFECDESYVNEAKVCDGRRDCGDGSDEEQGCATLQCGG